MSKFSRRQDNTQNQQFRIAFVERLYDGAPRWHDKEAWRTHGKTVKGDKKGVLEREPQVKTAIRRSHRKSILHRRDGVPYLASCVNPDCRRRSQVDLSEHTIKAHPAVEQRPTLVNSRQAGLRNLARAEAKKNEECDECNWHVRTFPLSRITEKWVYVLREDGDSLEHYVAIEMYSQSEGQLYRKMKGGVYIEKNSSEFNGFISLSPDPTKYTWHFFLSPIRLGKASLELLRESRTREEDVQWKRTEAQPGRRGVPIDSDIQPWTTTVKRRFNSWAVKKGQTELIPLVDPFAWTDQAIDFDYLPILAAQQKLVRDPDEAAKSFICSTLQGALKRVVTKSDPLKYEDDPWDVKDDLLSVPSGGDGKNVAVAWTNRYKACLEYLTTEVNQACARVVIPARFSLAHRIVELGCQDGGEKRERLAYGLVHWQHILGQIGMCEEGARFLAWLTSSKGEPDDPLRPANRIPIKNVLGAELLGPGSEVINEVGEALPGSILAALSPGLIARSKDPGSEIVDRLAALGISSIAPTTTALLSSRDWLVSSPLESIGKMYEQRFPESVDIRPSNRATGFSRWSKRLKVFENTAQFDKAITLLLALKDYSKKASPFETEYERFARLSSRVQTPAKVAEFLTRNSREVVRATATGEVAALISKIELQGTGIIHTLSTAEYELWLSNGTVSTYRQLTKVARVLSGPVALLFGGTEMVTHGLQANDAWEADDPGLAVGHGLQAASGVLIIAVAGAECAALIGGAAAASWAGPVGWIAAGLMLAAAAVIAIWSKNDLEKFAQHCFLGDSYGNGDWSNQTGNTWMAGEPWPALRYGSRSRRKNGSPWQLQRVALLRLISGFKTYTGPFFEVNQMYYGGTVNLAFMLESICFHVRISFALKDGSKEHCEARVWPKEGRYHWLPGKRPGKGTIRFGPNPLKPSWFQLAGNPKKKGTVDHFTFYVRADLDGNGTMYPLDDLWIHNSRTGSTFGKLHSVESRDHWVKLK